MYLVCTYQAISGAGKTFERWPEMIDNVIPYIGGEEEKSEKEPLKIWGKVEDGEIIACRQSKIYRTVPSCSRFRRSHGLLCFVRFQK